MNIRSKHALEIGMAAVALCCSVGRAQEKKDAVGGHAVVHVADLKWSPIMKGCELASLAGDMNAEGAPFVLRLRCAADTRIPAHWHPTDETVTVLQGVFQVGMGDKFDAGGLETMNVGDVDTIAKEKRHFAFSKTATLLQIHGVGPFKVNWVNPADVVPPDAPKK